MNNLSREDVIAMIIILKLKMNVKQPRGKSETSGVYSSQNRFQQAMIYDVYIGFSRGSSEL
jgi:hypothetical protein